MLGVGAILSVSGTVEQRVAAIAALQRGCVARRQLLAAGLSPGKITRLTAKGYLYRQFLGVYTVGHPGERPLMHETAALLAAGEQAVLSHHTAAVMWGLTFGHANESQIHLTVPFQTSTRQRQGIVVHRTRVWDQRDVRLRHGLPITSPGRTLLDVAEVETTTQRQLERALDEALVMRITTRSQLAGLIRRHYGRRGAARVQALLFRGTSTMTRTELEERFLALVRAARLPDPECNVRLNGFEVDALWRAQRIVVELDGYRFHTTRSAFERDRRKDAVLKQAGLDVNRFTWDQLRREPYLVIARVATALAQATPMLAQATPMPAETTPIPPQATPMFAQATQAGVNTRSHTSSPADPTR